MHVYEKWAINFVVCSSNKKLELCRAHAPRAASASRSTSALCCVYLAPVDDLYLHSMLGLVGCAHVH